MIGSQFNCIAIIGFNWKRKWKKNKQTIKLQQSEGEEEEAAKKSIVREARRRKLRCRCLCCCCAGVQQLTKVCTAQIIVMGSFCCCFFSSSYFFIFVARLQQQQDKADQFCTVFVFVAVLLFLSLPFLLPPSLSVCFFCLITCCNCGVGSNDSKSKTTKNCKSFVLFWFHWKICWFSRQRTDSGSGQRRNSADFCCFDILVLLCCCCYFCFCLCPCCCCCCYCLFALGYSASVCSCCCFCSADAYRIESSCRGSDATLGLRRLRARRTPCRQAGRGWENKLAE